MKESFGEHYMSRFRVLEKEPFAAASIGQVHYGELAEGGEQVAVKIQYPGVARSIQSDIDNLMSVMNVTQLLPKGMYVENVVKVMKRELADECDYVREAACYRKFGELLAGDAVFRVPRVFDQITHGQVLTTELIDGEPFDKCVELSQEERNHVGFIIAHFALQIASQ